MSIITAACLIVIVLVAVGLIKVAGLLRMSQAEIDADAQRLREQGNSFIKER